MLYLKSGIYIKSTSALVGSFFENTTILIVEDNEEGSTGFVINRPFEKSLNDLIEFNHCNAFPLMDGGPVDRDHLYILHKRPDLIDGGKPVSNGCYLGSASCITVGGRALFRLGGHPDLPNRCKLRIPTSAEHL